MPIKRGADHADRDERTHQEEESPIGSTLDRDGWRVSELLDCETSGFFKVLATCVIQHEIRLVFYVVAKGFERKEIVGRMVTHLDSRSKESPIFVEDTD